MSSLPAGRELDRAVALALGWTQFDEVNWRPPGTIHVEGQGGVTPHVRVERKRPLPMFSVWYDHVEEMLAWLRARSPDGIVNLEILSAEETVADCVRAKDGSRIGRDIPNALALLVVAVAEAAKEER